MNKTIKIILGGIFFLIFSLILFVTISPYKFSYINDDNNIQFAFFLIISFTIYLFLVLKNRIFKILFPILFLIMSGHIFCFMILDLAFGSTDDIKREWVIDNYKIQYIIPLCYSGHFSSYLSLNEMYFFGLFRKEIGYCQTGS